MATAAAALLDELMGKNRDRAPHERGVTQHWSDPEVGTRESTRIRPSVLENPYLRLPRFCVLFRLAGLQAPLVWVLPVRTVRKHKVRLG